MIPATLVTIVTCLLELSTSSPVYNMQPAFITNNIGPPGGRNIRNLLCVSRKNNGLRGVCMFAIDCLKANGTHLGTCIDRFYFGSCCHIEPHHEIVDNSIDEVVLDHREPPSRLGSTIRPITTTKHSLFSVNSVNKSTIATTKAPVKTTTTMSSTSVSSSTKRTTFGDKIETTTPSQKLQTFQSVDGVSTTTSSSTKYSTTTPPIITKVTKITTTTSRTTKKPSSTTSKPVLSTKKPTVTSARPVPTLKPSRVTIRSTTKPTKVPRPTQKPSKITSKPSNITTTKKPTKPNVTTKRPSINGTIFSTSKPSKRPVVNATIVKVTTRPSLNKTTGVTATTTIKGSSSSTLSTEKPTTTRTTTPITSTSSTTPISTTSTSNISISTSTVSNEIPSSKQNATSSEILGNPATNEIETVKPLISTTISSSVSSVSTPSSTTMSSSTVKPGLVTWTVTDTKNHTSTATVGDNEVVETTDWIPLTTPDGWVLLPSLPSVATPPTDNISTLTPASTSTTIRQNVTVASVIIPLTTTSPVFQSSPTSAATTLEPLLNATTSSPSVPASISTSQEPSTVGPLTSSTASTVGEIENVSSSTTETIANATTEGNQTTSSTTETNLTELAEKPAVNMSDFTNVCGRRMFPEARIVGGEKSFFGRWPWQISLRQWRTSTYLHKCGAALLNENWAITAAHCVDNVPPSDLLLRLGEHDLSTEGEPYLHQERRVQIVASHPQFDPRTFEYDLALLRFYEPVQFQPNILPVCVPLTDENFVGRTAYVTGWGRLYEDGPLPSVLQEVSVPVINNTVCEQMYRSAGYIEHIPHIFICAGWRRGGFDSCEGDSGGPMVIQRDDGRFLLAGVISWGIGCAEPNQPGVYTRISEFRDWINQILQF